MQDKPNSDLPDVSIGDAKPYRSPADVTDEPKQHGMKPVFAMVVVASLFLSGLLAYAYARSSAKEDLTGHVKSFGYHRGGVQPVEEPWDRGGGYDGDPADR